MTQSGGHYRDLVQAKGKTRFARCGYNDRFDPFVLNKVPRLRRMYESLFTSFLGDAPFPALLDVGCGTGVYFDALAKHAEHIDALDASEDMIQIARDYCDKMGINTIHPQTGSSECLPFADETYDVVVELDTLHHVGDVPRTLAEIRRVLKPGGRFLVFEPNTSNTLMFVAHAVPREERQALKRNRPGVLTAALEVFFETVRWAGVCELITDVRGFRRSVLDAYLGVCKAIGAERRYPRQAWLGVKK